MNQLWILAAAGDGDAQGEFIVDPGNAGDQFDRSGTTQNDGSQPTDQETSQGRGPGNMNFIFIMVAVMVVMYFVTTGGKKKQEKKHKQMVRDLQKNDRIRTIGGILGTVINVKDNEITIKIDESNNTKMTVASTAIASKVMSDDN